MAHVKRIGEKWGRAGGVAAIDRAEINSTSVARGKYRIIQKKDIFGYLFLIFGFILFDVLHLDSFCLVFYIWLSFFVW